MWRGEVSGEVFVMLWCCSSVGQLMVCVHPKFGVLIWNVALKTGPSLHACKMQWVLISFCLFVLLRLPAEREILFSELCEDIYGSISACELYRIVYVLKGSFSTFCFEHLLRFFFFKKKTCRRNNSLKCLSRRELIVVQ